MRVSEKITHQMRTSHMDTQLVQLSQSSVKLFLEISLTLVKGSQEEDTREHMITKIKQE